MRFPRSRHPYRRQQRTTHAHAPQTGDLNLVRNPSPPHGGRVTHLDRPQRDRQHARRDVRVNVQHLPRTRNAQGREHGHAAAGQDTVDGRLIDALDLAHEAELLAVLDLGAEHAADEGHGGEACGRGVRGVWGGGTKKGGAGPFSSDTSVSQAAPLLLQQHPGSQLLGQWRARKLSNANVASLAMGL